MNDDATFLNIENAAHSGAFGLNDQAEPPDAQCAAGNYKKGRVTLCGLTLAIEQPRNSYRTGIDAKTGKRWVNRMAAHYGYLCGTKGNDGDEVDCFIGPYPQSDRAYVINQNIGGRFDEVKAMLAFPDEASARRAYLDSYDRDWRGLASLIPVSIPQLKWWLKHGNMRRALRADDLPHEGLEAMTRKVYWNSDAMPFDGTLDHILYDIRRSDAGENLLMDAVTAQEIIEDSDGELSLDALVSPYARLERRMEILRGIMERTGDKVKPVAMQVTQPFKQRGVANVAAIFELSDGQTVSIYFHNPDTTPGKMTPTDEVISWKWLLNKKDITIVVAPERGADLNVREVARRIMRLAEKNSAAFARANAKRAERMQTIADLKTEITQLEGELKSAQNELEVAKLEWEEAQERAKAQTDIESDDDDDHPLTDEEKAAYLQRIRNSHTIGVADPNEPESNEEVRNINGVPTIVAKIEPRRESQPNEFTAPAKPYDEYLNEANGNSFEAAKAFYKTELQGKIVKTVIGDVHLLGGKARKEIQYGAKDDNIKAELIPQVPVILKSGEYKGKSELYRNREDRYVAFHDFQKSLVVGDKEVTANVSVGERDDGQFQYTAYSLNHSGRKGWTKKEALRTPELLTGREGFTTDSADHLLRAPGYEPGREDCGAGNVSDEIEAQTLDAVNAEDGGGWNIRILKVVDLKTGERLRELEDGGWDDDEEDAPDAVAPQTIQLPAGISGAEMAVLVGALYKSPHRKGVAVELMSEDDADKYFAIQDRLIINGYLNKSGSVSRKGTALLEGFEKQIGGDNGLVPWIEAQKKKYRPEQQNDEKQWKEKLETVISVLKNGYGYEYASKWGAGYDSSILVPPFETNDDYEDNLLEISNYEARLTVTINDAEIALGDSTAQTAEALAAAIDALIRRGQGKSKAYIQAMQTLEQGAAQAGMDVHYGDFNDSASGGLFDTVSGSELIYGITAQLHVKGEVQARARISEDGKLTILHGASEQDVLGEPASAAELAELLRSTLVAKSGSSQTDANQDEYARVRDIALEESQKEWPERDEDMHNSYAERAAQAIVDKNPNGGAFSIRIPGDNETTKRIFERATGIKLKMSDVKSFVQNS